MLIAGVVVSDPGSSLIVTDKSSISENRGESCLGVQSGSSGIRMLKGAKVTLQAESSVINNYGSGIVALDEGTCLEISAQSKVKGNTFNGIWLQHGSQATIVGSSIEANGQNGIVAEGVGTAFCMSGSSIVSYNKGVGVVLHRGAHGSVEHDSCVKQNFGDGIGVADKETRKCGSQQSNIGSSAMLNCGKNSNTHIGGRAGGTTGKPLQSDLPHASEPSSDRR